MKTVEMAHDAKKLADKVMQDAQFVKEFLDGGEYLPHFIAGVLFTNRENYYEGEKDFISLVGCYDVVNGELGTDAKYTDLH